MGPISSPRSSYRGPLAVADGVGKLGAWFVLDPVVPDSNTIMSNNNSRARNCYPGLLTDAKLPPTKIKPIKKDRAKAKKDLEVCSSS